MCKWFVHITLTFKHLWLHIQIAIPPSKELFLFLQQSNFHLKNTTQNDENCIQAIMNICRHGCRWDVTKH